MGGRGGEGEILSLILFADDTLVFCRSDEGQLIHLSWVLMWFEVLSGLKIILEKSEIIPVGRVENIGFLVEAFGCWVGLCRPLI